MGKTEVVNVTGAAGEERLEFVLEVASHPFSIKVVEPGHLASIETTGGDVRNCFFDLRRQLEAHGILLCCMGARPDVWASGMLSQFTDGRMAYLHRVGARPSRADEVDIFAPADAADVVTMEQHRIAVRAMFDRGRP